MDAKAVHQNEENGLLKLITQTHQKIKVMFVLFLILLALDGCGEENKPAPTSPIARTMLPPSLTPSPSISPTATVIPTHTITSTPTVTPLPEGTIVLNWGYSVSPSDPESIAKGENWAKGLSTATGLNIVAQPGPSTDMEILNALRNGKIHMATLNALAFGYGLAQGWIMPGPVDKYTYQPSGSIMFVARTDSGLVPSEPPEVFQQLAGKHPCWPDINQGWWYGRPPIYEYLLPTGLLSQAGVELGQPVFVTYTNTHKDNTTQVFLGECDFAVVEAMPENYFLMQWSPYLGSKGATITDWKTQMQVLYTTPPLEPFYIMAYSSQLGLEQREMLTKAILRLPAVQGDYGMHHWIPYDEEQDTFYNQFQTLVDASGVNVADYLDCVWDLWLRKIINPSPAPSPIPGFP